MKKYNKKYIQTDSTIIFYCKNEDYFRIKIGDDKKSIIVMDKTIKIIDFENWLGKLTLEEIENKIDESLKKISETRKFLGYDCFNEDAMNKIKAINLIWKNEEFSETVEDLIKNIEELEKTEESKKVINLAKRFLEYGCNIDLEKLNNK